MGTPTNPHSHASGPHSRAHCHCYGHLITSGKPQITGISNPRSCPVHLCSIWCWESRRQLPALSSSCDNTDINLSHGWRTWFLRIFPHTGPKSVTLYFLEQIQSFSNSGNWSVSYALSFSLFQVKHPCFSSPFFTCHDWESVYYSAGFSVHQEEVVPLNLSTLFNQKNSIICPFQWLGKLLKYPTNAMGYFFKNADLPSQIQLQCSKMNLRSLKFEIHCSKRCPLFKFPWLFPKYYIFMF